MIKEFKEFAMRGNVIDMAIGIIMGGAFGEIVTKIVDILMNLISAATAGVQFKDLSITIGGVGVAYGMVIQSIINFIIIAFFMFLIVKAMNTMMGKDKKVEEVEEVTTKECPHCLSEIPIKATRCPNCTSELEGYHNEIEAK